MIGKIILTLIKWFIFTIVPFIIVVSASNSDQTAGMFSVEEWLTSRFDVNPLEGRNLIESDACIGCDMLASVFDSFSRGADYALDFLLEFSIELLAIFLVLWTVFYSYQAILQADTITPKVYFSKIMKRLLWGLIIAFLLGAFTPKSTNLVKMSAQIYMIPVMKIGNYVSQKMLQLPDDICEGYESKTLANDSVFSNEMKKDFLCYISSSSLVIMGGMQGGGQMMYLGWSIKSFYTFISGYWVFLAFFSLATYFMFLFLDVLLSLLIPVFILPLLLVGYVFDRTSGWLFSFAVKALEKVVLFMITLTFSMLIVYSVYTHVGDRYFPAPLDGFSFVFPDYFNRVDTPEKSLAREKFNQCMETIKSSNMGGEAWSFQKNTSRMNEQTLSCYKQLPTPETGIGLLTLLMLWGLYKLTFKMFEFIQGNLGLGGSLPIKGISKMTTDFVKTGLSKAKDSANFLIDFIGGKFMK